jgi:hypothetical protein
LKIADFDDQAVEADGDAADQADKAEPRHMDVVAEIIAAENASDDRREEFQADRGKAKITAGTAGGGFESHRCRATALAE